MAIPRNLANFAAGIDASNNIKAASGIFGTTPATTGVVRIPNDSPIYARNPGNDGDRHVIAFNSSGEVAIAGDGNNTVIGTSVGTVKTPTTIGVGAATPAASGAGITFPADQTIIGASSDANTLDDYEEGTWTPVFQGDVNPSGLSLGNTDATYTKIGNSVRLSLNVTVSNIGTGGSGGMKVTGLPFTASSAMDFQPCTTESEGLLASVSNFVPIIEGNTTSILLYAGWNGTGGPTQLAWGTNAKNGMIFRLSVVYHAA
jgi:hypothetical protein